MTRLRNVTQGWRGINPAGSHLSIDFDPGEEKDIELSEKDLADALATEWFKVVEVVGEEAPAPTPEPAKPHPLDHDGDGKPGGSKPRAKK